MRRYECGTKARLSFSGGPHAPVNMADSMDCFWIQRDDGSAEELQGFAKTWRTKCNTVTAQKTCHSLLSSTHIHFFHTIHHVYRVAKLIVYRFYELDLKFISFMEVSYPKNKEALDGAARNSVGTNPLYRAFGPSSRIRQRNTSRTPRGYVPSGAV